MKTNTNFDLLKNKNFFYKLVPSTLIGTTLIIFFKKLYDCKKNLVFLETTNNRFFKKNINLINNNKIYSIFFKSRVKKLNDDYENFEKADDFQNNDLYDLKRFLEKFEFFRTFIKSRC